MNWWDDPDIARVAGAVAKRFRGYIEVEDLKGELVLWCLEHPGAAEKLWSEDTPWWFRNRRLWSVAQRYARQQKAIMVGHEVEDEFFYSPALVKTLLPDAFEHDSTPPSNGISEVKVKHSGGPGMEWETLMADVRRALELLSERDFELLWSVYGTPNGSLNAYAGVKGWDWRRAVREERRALRRLVDLLGGTSPWVEDLTEEPRKGPSEPRGATKPEGATVG